MTKKDIVKEIRDKLDILGIKKGFCANLDSIPNLCWVSPTQVCLREHLYSMMYRSYRQPLYSKGISIAVLCAIKNELEEKIAKNTCGIR